MEKIKLKRKTNRINKLDQLLSDKKKRYPILLLMMLPFLIAIGIFGFIAFREAKNLMVLAKGEPVEVKDENKIEGTNYILRDNATDVQKEYLDSSLFVCTSRFEGFGMGIVEAMACGLPVVAFDCLWGPRSIITDGEDGLLVENGHIEKMAETILSLISHPERISEMGMNARRNVQRFNIDAVAKKWKRLFDSL